MTLSFAFIFLEGPARVNVGINTSDSTSPSPPLFSEPLNHRHCAVDQVIIPPQQHNETAATSSITYKHS